MNAHLGEEARAEIAEETPVCRIGEPREVAEAVLFLSGEGAAFITGDVMNISGGFVV
jgi:3-oxoacyl-[acyl-carrier protein] reductase